jgi:hypothetical protein
MANVTTVPHRISQPRNAAADGRRGAAGRQKLLAPLRTFVDDVQLLLPVLTAASRLERLQWRSLFPA